MKFSSFFSRGPAQLKEDLPRTHTEGATFSSPETQSIVGGVRRTAVENWKKGIELEKEWRTVNWWREDGWNDEAKTVLLQMGYRLVFADSDSIEYNNVLLEWGGERNPDVTKPP